MVFTSSLSFKKKTVLARGSQKREYLDRENGMRKSDRREIVLHESI
jgi:hypothetical protein